MSEENVTTKAIRQLIELNRIETALDKIITLGERDNLELIRNKASALKQRFRQNKEENLAGRLTAEQVTAENNRIVTASLVLLDELGVIPDQSFSANQVFSTDYAEDKGSVSPSNWTLKPWMKFSALFIVFALSISCYFYIYLPINNDSCREAIGLRVYLKESGSEFNDDPASEKTILNIVSCELEEGKFLKLVFDLGDTFSGVKFELAQAFMDKYPWPLNVDGWYKEYKKGKIVYVLDGTHPQPVFFVQLSN